MKREAFIFLSLLSLLFVIPLISPLEIDMKTNISQGETVIASIEGNFLDVIAYDNIEFYRGHVRTSFVYDVGNIDNKYYIYFQTEGKTQNNYSIVIKGVRYYVGSSISQAEIFKNFTVNSEQADFNIDNGFVVTDGNFSIGVQNLNANTITIDVNTEITSGSSVGFFDFLFKNEPISNSGDSITLLSGETENIEITLDDITETTVRKITLSSANMEYEIPVYVIAEYNPTNNTNNTSNNNISEDNETIEPKNETDNGSFWDIFKKENKTETTPVENDSDAGYDIITDDSGNLIIVDDNGTIIDAPASSKTCAQLKGIICSSNKICENNNATYAKDAKCCLSSCVKKSNKNGKIIGWVIIGFIIILLIWFKIKFSKTKRKSIDFLNTPKRK